MKRFFSLLLATGVLAPWAAGRQEVKTTIEGGVEVVLNHKEPYRVPGEPSAVILEREFVIDAESPDLFKAGLTDILRFGVGKDGSIYIVQRPRKAVPVIFKFDKAGHLQSSFGQFGRGPGRSNGARISASSAATRSTFLMPRGEESPRLIRLEGS